MNSIKKKMNAMITSIFAVILFTIACMPTKIANDNKDDMILNTAECCVNVESELTAGIQSTIYNLLEDRLSVADFERNDVENVQSAIGQIDENVIETSFVSTPVQKTMYVSVNLLNIRSEATMNSEQLCTIPIGTLLEAVSEMSIYKGDEKIDQWTCVVYNGVQGYVKSEYIIDYPPLISLGIYDITYYCPCEICCDVANRPTASGAMPVAGLTIAADRSIPFGTKVVIDGHEYVVQDRGGAIKGNHIDIFCNSHEEALSMTRHNTEVFMVVE